MNWKDAAAALRFAAWLNLLAPRPPRPESISLPERLAQFPTEDLPLQKTVTIHWNVHAVPFIEAQTDRDLAVAIGLIHAQLRLGQMETYRHIAQGRLSEMVGGAAVPIDHTLRIFGFAKAVPEILQALPDETREWLTAYVEGINTVLFRCELPHEFKLFDLKREAWSITDILTLGRLFALDTAWLVWMRLLRARHSPLWDDLWAKLIANAQGPIPVADPDEPVALDILESVNNRAGSNAIAVRRGGGTWMACDPHLGLSLPSNWLLAGYHSPGHHAVGLMIPGVPAIVSGRNPHIAWGGASLHGHSSALYAIPENGSLAERIETIKVRWGTPRTMRVRWNGCGPVLSDSPYFPYPGLALRWVGHRPSDEVTAMLKLSRAQDWRAFKDALTDYAVPGLNMVYADRDGHVGHALAAQVMPEKEDDFISARWSDELLRGADLPDWFDPPGEVVISANQRPPCDVPVGRFYSSPERAERLRALLGAAAAIDRVRLAEIQNDVKSTRAFALSRRLIRAARSSGDTLPRKAAELLSILETWDGSYIAEAPGATVFESLLYHFTRLYYLRDVLTAYAASWATRDIIGVDIERAPLIRLAPVVRKALMRCPRPRPWGDVHRLVLQHPLALVPGAGRRYRVCDLPASGGSETVMKTANGLTAKRHRVRFGANARFIANLSDPDDNHFVLLGGQDGWFGSANYSDQIPLWRKRECVRIPLQLDTIRRSFRKTLVLRPA